MLSLLAAALAACSDSSGGGRSGARLQFSVPSLSVGEGAGSIVITARRVGSLKGPVTVDYTTADETAAAGFDYTATSGTSSWPDGDGADRTFVVPILDDAASEGDETLRVTLGTPTGKAGLGVPAVVTITIVDDDPGNSGQLDPTFGTAGVVRSDPSGDRDQVWSVVVRPPSIYLAGSDEVPGAGDSEWRIERRSIVDGALDPAFATAGVLVTNPGAGADECHHLAVNGSHIYAVGYESGAITDQLWRIEKRNVADGSLDTAFGAGGVVTSNPGVDGDQAYAVAIDATDLFVIGTQRAPIPGDTGWRTEKRSLVDGSLDAAFGSLGAVFTNPGGGDDQPWSIALDGTHIYVAGYEGISGADDRWRIEKRWKVDAALDGAFGSGGVLLDDPTTGTDRAHAIALDATSLYVAGVDGGPGGPGGTNTQWRIAKRDLATGAADLFFGFGGWITSDPSGGDDWAYGLVVDGGDIFVTGTDASLAGTRGEQWRLERRRALDGALEPAFGAGGVALSDPSDLDDEAWWVAVDPTYVYVGGYDRSSGPDDAALRLERRFR